MKRADFSTEDVFTRFAGKRTAAAQKARLDLGSASLQELGALADRILAMLPAAIKAASMNNELPQLTMEREHSLLVIVKRLQAINKSYMTIGEISEVQLRQKTERKFQFYLGSDQNWESADPREAVGVVARSLLNALKDDHEFDDGDSAKIDLGKERIALVNRLAPIAKSVLVLSSMNWVLSKAEKAARSFRNMEIDYDEYVIAGKRGLERAVEKYEFTTAKGSLLRLLTIGDAQIKGEFTRVLRNAIKKRGLMPGHYNRYLRARKYQEVETQKRGVPISFEQAVREEYLPTVRQPQTQGDKKRMVRIVNGVMALYDALRGKTEISLDECRAGEERNLYEVLPTSSEIGIFAEGTADRQVLQLFGQLNEIERKILALRFGFDQTENPPKQRSFRQIAEIMGLPETQVRTRYNTAIQSIRDEVLVDEAA
ncbi:MAG: sigma factor-like helix-turn-helix DNA-binding protein [bacterium]